MELEEWIDVEEADTPSDEEHKQSMRHAEEMHHLHKKHAEELHKQTVKHRDEAHRQNMHIAKTGGYYYNPPIGIVQQPTPPTQPPPAPAPAPTA